MERLARRAGSAHCVPCVPPVPRRRCHLGSDPRVARARVVARQPHGRGARRQPRIGHVSAGMGAAQHAAAAARRRRAVGVVHPGLCENSQERRRAGGAAAAGASARHAAHDPAAAGRHGRAWLHVVLGDGLGQRRRQDAAAAAERDPVPVHDPDLPGGDVGRRAEHARFVRAAGGAADRVEPDLDRRALRGAVVGLHDCRGDRLLAGRDAVPGRLRAAADGRGRAVARARWLDRSWAGRGAAPPRAWCSRRWPRP